MDSFQFHETKLGANGFDASEERVVKKPRVNFADINTLAWRKVSFKYSYSKEIVFIFFDPYPWTKSPAAINDSLQKLWVAGNWRKLYSNAEF